MSVADELDKLHQLLAKGALTQGEYQLQVQASWFEIGTYVYRFNVAVS